MKARTPTGTELQETKLAAFLSRVDKRCARAKSTNKYVDSISQYRGLLECEFLLSSDDLKNVKKEFKAALEPNKRNAFVFGAGISMGPPFSLPSWPKLLKNAVLSEFFDSYDIKQKIGQDEFDKTLAAQGDYFGAFDLYELGQFLEVLRRDANKNDERPQSSIERRTDLEMYRIVKNALLAGRSNFDESEGRRVLNAQALSTLDKSLIKYLCKLATERGVNRVITYNYDNAFEYAFSQTVSSKRLTPVFIDDQLGTVVEDHDNLPIYHVHGFIPLFNEPYSNNADINKHLCTNEGKKLILSESSYDNMAHSSYKWRNVIQIDTFLRYNCIFFGFSATDINFKRIVKLMDWHTEDSNNSCGHNAENVKHYIFMTIDDFLVNIFGEKWDKSLNRVALADLDTKLKYLYFTLQMKRKYLRSMHIYPIWCTKADIDLYVKNLLKD